MTRSTMSQADLLALADRVFIKNYRQAPIVLTRGHGAEVWDAAGRRYLDMTAGIAVCGLGHAHPAFTSRVAEQLGRAREAAAAARAWSSAPVVIRD